MAAAHQRLQRFGRFTFDPLTGELTSHGRRTRLPPQPAAVLSALLEEPGELVTRDALRHRIWPDDTFVDFDHGLHVAVARLRESLDDHAGRSRYVETIPRRGYRFIAQVEPQSTADAPPGAHPRSGPTPTAPRPPDEVRPAEPFTAVPPWPHRHGALLLLLVLVTAVVLGVAGASRLRGGGVRVERLVDRDGMPGSTLPSNRREARAAADRGWHFLQDGGGQALVAAKGYFRRAIDVDSTLSDGYAGLALAYVASGWYDYEPPSDAFTMAEATARTALQRNARDGRAHAAMGFVGFVHHWDTVAAEAEFRQAVAAAPTDQRVLRWHATYLMLSGRGDEASQTWKRMLDRDPLSVGAAMGLATSYCALRRFDAARAVLEGLLSRAPRHARARGLLASVLAASGACEGARPESNRAAALLPSAPEDEVFLVDIAWAEAVCDRPERASALLSRTDPIDQARWSDPVTLAALRGALGQHEDAIELLERAVEERSPFALVLPTDFMLDPLRHEPRFRVLTDRVQQAMSEAVATTR